MELAFKRNDKDTYCGPNCGGEQKRKEGDDGDDPSVVERETRMRQSRKVDVHDRALGRRQAVSDKEEWQGETVPFSQLPAGNTACQLK